MQKTMELMRQTEQPKIEVEIRAEEPMEIEENFTVKVFLAIQVW